MVHFGDAVAHFEDTVSWIIFCGNSFGKGLVGHYADAVALFCSVVKQRLCVRKKSPPIKNIINLVKKALL